MFLFSGLIVFAFPLFPNGLVLYASIGIVVLALVGIGIWIAVLWFLISFALSLGSFTLSFLFFVIVFHLAVYSLV